MKTSAILALALAAPADAAGRRLKENLDMHKLLDAGKQGRVGSTINFKLDKAHKLVKRGQTADLATNIAKKLHCAPEAQVPRRASTSAQKAFGLDMWYETKCAHETSDKKKVAGATSKLKHFLDSEDHDGVAYIEPELEHKTMFQANDRSSAASRTTTRSSSRAPGTRPWATRTSSSRSSTRASTWSTGPPEQHRKNPGEMRGNGVDDDNNGASTTPRRNFADDTGTDLMGNHWHGTHCGGTIAADTNNGKGAGVAGGDGRPVVFAAGNDADDGDWYPAYYDGAIAVAATDNDGVAAGFTCYGDWIDIRARRRHLPTMADEGNCARAATTATRTARPWPAPTSRASSRSASP
ncbi:serine-type endopeptidase [Aureococcus anophagefferens]|nr:serine-type endopeptidase [Aureococcus anophagefferens]